MGSKIGSSRLDYRMRCLEAEIDENSVVRLIDAFVDGFDLKEMGFKMREGKQYGRDAYSTKSIVKLYIYSYFHKTRSSRQIERQCRLNIEIHWLLENLTPSYKTIAEFRKNNTKALTAIFKEVNKLIRSLGLYKDITTIAVDGTRMHGQNSKLNNFNNDKLKSLIKRGDKEISTYLDALSKADSNEESTIEEKDNIKNKIEELKNRRLKNINLQKELEESGETQISTTDPDCRRMTRLRDGSIVGFNGLITVSDEHKLIVAADVVNVPDANTLSQMSIEAQENIGKDKLIVLADCGFDTGEELYKCEQAGITPYVPNKATKSNNYSKDKFTYNKEGDFYTCPKSKKLETTGTVSITKSKGKKEKKYKEYYQRDKACNECPVREMCLGKSKIENNGQRSIRRYEHEECRERSETRVNENREIYTKRKGIVEHPFGSFKRSYDFSYFLLIGLEKARCEFKLLCSCYNLKRLISMFGVKELIKWVKKF